MAANAKYQRAPQDEPDDDYTQAPPSYAAGSSSHDEEQGLFGAPRSSEDNLPDDFKVMEQNGEWDLGLVAIVLVAWLVVGLIVSRVTFRWIRRDA